MQAWLVVNEFLRNGKFKAIEEWVAASAKKYDVELLVKSNTDIMVTIGRNGIRAFEGERPDFVLFWDKDVKAANYLESMGFRVSNSAKAIAICDDKALTHMVLAKEGIPMPKTVIAPMTYMGIGYCNYYFLQHIETEIDYPIILKECFGSFGQQVYKVEDREDMKAKLNHLGGKPLLFQEFVNTSIARDVRIQVVGNRVVAAMYRYSETGDFRSNITNGGKMKPYQPTKEQSELAIRCVKTIGLDFAGVDLLFGDEEEPLVCEVNSNAHFVNIYECTGINTADAIMEHMVHKNTV